MVVQVVVRLEVVLRRVLRVVLDVVSRRGRRCLLSSGGICHVHILHVTSAIPRVLSLSLSRPSALEHDLYHYQI